MSKPYALSSASFRSISRINRRVSSGVVVASTQGSHGRRCARFSSTGRNSSHYAGEGSRVIVPSGLQPIARLVPDVPVVIAQTSQNLLCGVKSLGLPRRRPRSPLSRESGIVGLDDYVRVVFSREVVHQPNIDSIHAAFSPDILPEPKHPSPGACRRVLAAGPLEEEALSLEIPGGVRPQTAPPGWGPASSRSALLLRTREMSLDHSASSTIPHHPPRAGPCGRGAQCPA